MSLAIRPRLVPAPTADRRRWRPYTIAFAVVAAAVGVPFVTRGVSEWDTVFVPTAAHLLAGDDLYDQPHAYTYPPFQAMFAVPAVGLPRWASRLGWYAANVACLAWLLRSSWLLAGGGRLDGADTDRREHVACWLGLLAGLPFLLNAVSHQQTDVVLAALAVGGCERLARGRGFLAATLWGLAAAMKCTPLLFAPYLLVRRRPAAAGWLVLVAVGANLLPDAIHRPADGHTAWMTKWYANYLAPMTRADHTPGVWASHVVYNQSAVGAANRWTHTTWHRDGRKVAVESVPPTATPGELKLWLLAAAAGCGLVGWLAVRAGRRRAEPGRTAWEAGLILGGMLLFSPMSSAAHFGPLLLPGFVFARAIVLDGRRDLVPWLAALIAAAAATNKDLVGGAAYTIGLWYGSAMWAAVAAVGGSAAGAMRRPSAEPAAPPVETRLAA